MEEIRLRCGECGQRYRVGRDALVVTVFSRLNKFSLSVTERNFERFASNRANPDDIGLLERDWESLKSDESLDQSEQITLIQHCLRHEPGQRWWRCHACGTEQPYRHIRVLEYSGRSVAAATKAATDAWQDDRILSLKVAKDVHRETLVVGVGSMADAEMNVMSALPPDAFDIGSPECTCDPWSGTNHIVAISRWKARRAWRASAPAGARLIDIECSQPASGGFLGLGRTPGLWTVSFTTPYSAKIAFSRPAVVEVEVED